jgi:proline iminopeptidase
MAIAGRTRVKEGFLDVPGGRVWYRAVGEGGIPLLCLHGGPGIPHDYLENLEDLADRRMVVFYDQLGCGNSERPDDPSLWTLDRAIAELVAVREQLDLDDIHLFGNSWGGWLSLQYVLDKKPQLRSLTLSSSPPSVKRWIEDANMLKSQLPADVRKTLDHHQEKEFFACPEWYWAMTVFYRRHVCRADPWPDGVERAFGPGFGAQVYGTMWGPSEFGPVTGNLQSWDVTDRVHEIKVPTLITCGRYDEATPAHVEDMHRRMPGSEFVIFEQSSHLAFVEEREAYVKTVNDFLERVERRKAD